MEYFPFFRIDFLMAKKTIIVNGYAYPFISDEALYRNLPDLTFLTTFSYGLTPEGDLVGLDDERLVQEALLFNTGALMALTAFTPEGNFDSDRASLLFQNPEVQDRYLLSVIDNLQTKNMRGVDFDFEFVYPEDRDAYVAFVAKTREILNALGYVVTVALAPKTSTDQPGLLYQGHDYFGMGQAANLALIMTYEWGYTYGPPMAVAPLNKVREVLDYAVTQIPPEKILMGIPNYGYDWTLPFVKDETRARKITNNQALEIADQYQAVISFDPIAMSPYFNYYDEEGREHEVWFEDEQSIRAKMSLIIEYGLAGLSYWNIMSFYEPNSLVLNELFDVLKDETVLQGLLEEAAESGLLAEMPVDDALEEGGASS